MSFASFPLFEGAAKVLQIFISANYFLIILYKKLARNRFRANYQQVT